ncbi:hypothetical protein [Variovorax durovernensis]
MHVNRQRFIKEIEARGYTCATSGRFLSAIYLPGLSERCIPTFSGLYFAIRATQARASMCCESWRIGTTLPAVDTEKTQASHRRDGDAVAADCVVAISAGLTGCAISTGSTAIFRTVA